MKGGKAEPNDQSRPAQLNMDRQTNSRQNRRHQEQAYLGYWLGLKQARGMTGHYFGDPERTS
jgi:hypothetical protein